MVSLKSLEPLIVFDCANNHMGDVKHGLSIIREVHKSIKGFRFNFAFKLQYRHLDTLIHPDYRTNMDIKYIKRFSETRLEDYQLKELQSEMASLGFITMCTPYDEYSVGLAIEHGFDILKVASGSFTDWSLLERIVETDKPIIASTAGASLDDIEKVVSFLQHRQKDFALMHCVAVYPTLDSNLQLNQISFLKAKFPDVIIGYSTHENPQNIDAVKIAVGKGATILEKHVAVPTEKYGINKYSLTPTQVKYWLESVTKAFEMCGVEGGRTEFGREEIATLHSLRRGLFAREPIKKGVRIEQSDVFMALPTIKGQFTANDMSKYCEFHTDCDIEEKEPLLHSNTSRVDTRGQVYEYVKQVRQLVAKSGVVIPQKVEVELSHHYGLGYFDVIGCTIFTIVNREYCKKLIILLPGQKHPEQYHELKTETFNVLYGQMELRLDDEEARVCKVGDVVTIDKGVHHAFGTREGCVIEEISSTHYKDDSYYVDEVIMKNKNRKTQLTYWMD